MQFYAAGGGDPALLSHNELTTLFHEFGHGLHHMLTRPDGGIGIRDQRGRLGRGGTAQPVPENWCWGARGAGTDFRAPRDRRSPARALLDKLLAARNFQSAMMMARQLSWRCSTCALHSEWDTAGAAR